MEVKIVGAKMMTASEREKYVRERIGKGMRSGAAFVVKELKAVTGVQTSRRRGRNGKWYATTKAKPGAPPRRVSGEGQKSINWRDTGKSIVFSAIWYMLWWENHGHAWLRKTVDRLRDDLLRIVSKDGK